MTTLEAWTLRTASSRVTQLALSPPSLKTTSTLALAVTAREVVDATRIAVLSSRRVSDSCVRKRSTACSISWFETDGLGQFTS